MFKVDRVSYDVSLNHVFYRYKQNRSTEVCSKLKSPETRQVQERLVSTLEHMQVPKWDSTRCPEDKLSFVSFILISNTTNNKNARFHEV